MMTNLLGLTHVIGIAFLRIEFLNGKKGGTIQVHELYVVEDRGRVLEIQMYKVMT